MRAGTGNGTGVEPSVWRTPPQRVVQIRASGREDPLPYQG